jgi:LytS/YehU family sensor histidine kinase
LSFLASFILAYPDLYVIRFLENNIPWQKKFLLRIVLQLIANIIIAVSVAIFVSLISHALNEYEKPLHQILVTNSLIGALVNLFLMIILEAWIYFAESHFATKKAENLEKELSSIKFEVLKSQINPHFLFNSLNVLSSLIETDKKKAQQFIDEFSMVYRYVLETIEKKLVSVEEELSFIRSYYYLQLIRYGENLVLEINLPSHILKYFLPPLSLQVVVENAIKHNAINEDAALVIHIYEENNYLITENNINPKFSQSRTTGVGQDNLQRRYSLLTEKIPQFRVSSDSYIVKLPLIIPEDYESSDY